MTRWADLPVGQLSTWDGGSTAITAGSYGSSHELSVSLSGYGKKLLIDNIDARIDPNLIERKSADLLQATEASIEALVFEMLEGTTTTLVDNGAGGTTELLSASHSYDTTGNGVGDSYQSNRIAAALSYDSLSSLVELLQKWRTFGNVPQQLGRGPMTLIVSPKNRAIAHRLCESADLMVKDQEDTTSSFTGTSNANSGIKYQVSPFLTADDDDFWLVDDNNSPLRIWVPFSPTISINVLNSHQTEIAVSLWAKAFCEAPPAGLVGSNVA